MSFAAKRIFLILIVLALFQSGCEENTGVTAINTGDNHLDNSYCPTKVEILSLTEYVKKQKKVRVFVALTDNFTSQIKNPGIFRFELYERVLRSAEPKGKRLAIWDDIVLKDASLNNSYWRDFLRAYQFSLPFKSPNGQDCILEVTFMTPDETRLTDDYILKLCE